MADFTGIDQTATNADQPMHTALVQQIRENSVAALENRLPRCAAAFDAREPLRLVGAPSWNDTTRLVRVLHPFLWRRSHRDVTQIKVTLLIDVVGATTEVGALVVPVSEINQIPALANDWDDLPNADQSNATTATPIDAYLTLELPDSDDDLYVVFISCRSAQTGTTDEIVKTSDSTPPISSLRSSVLVLETASISDTAGTLSTSRPIWQTTITEANGAAKSGGLDYTLTTPRQAVYLDLDGTTPVIVAYPPYDGIVSVDTSFELHYEELSYIDVYSVDVEESAIRLPQATSALNAGEAPHVAAHIETTTIQHQAFHSVGGRVRSIAPPVHLVDTATIENDDLQLGDTLNRSHGYVTYQATEWHTIASCPVGEGFRFRDYDASTTYYKTGYEVHALFAIAANGYFRPAGREAPDTPELGLKARVVLTTTDTTSNTSVVTGDTLDLGRIAANTFPIGDMDDNSLGAYHPVGYLLRLHHYDDADNQLNGSLLSHSLLGGFPEDTWNAGRYALATLLIKDTQTSAIRGLELQVQGYAADVPAAGAIGSGTIKPYAFVHCLAWTVRDIVTTDADLVNWST